MRSHNPRHYLLYINWGLLLILLLEIGFYFFVFPKVAVNKIELDSDLVLSDAMLRKLLGFERSENYYSIDTDKMEQRARSFALVHDIQITKEFPDRLKVWLSSRKPVLVMLQKAPYVEPENPAEVKTQQGQSLRKRQETWQSVPILVDAEGVMFQIGLGNYDDVPILSGLEFSQGSPLNSRLPTSLHPLVLALDQLKQERPELYTMISEVRVQIAITNLVTDIYLESGSSYIKTNGKIDAHTLETAFIALAVLDRSNEHTRFLDMRTTEIVYRSVENATMDPILQQSRSGNTSTIGTLPVARQDRERSPDACLRC